MQFRAFGDRLALRAGLGRHRIQQRRHRRVSCTTCRTSASDRLLPRFSPSTGPPKGHALRKIIGQSLFSARLHRDLTITQLAERTGIPATEIEAIEAGQRTSAVNLIEICRVLKIRMSSLFRQKD
jgi:DNA-binding Xre family transcriptional regulator